MYDYLTDGVITSIKLGDGYDRLDFEAVTYFATEDDYDNDIPACEGMGVYVMSCGEWGGESIDGMVELFIDGEYQHGAIAEIAALLGKLEALNAKLDAEARDDETYVDAYTDYFGEGYLGEGVWLD